MKFKVGDKVRVREDLVIGNCYGKERFVDGMKEYKGQIFTIKKIYGGVYIFEKNLFNWTDEMLEKVKKEKETQGKTFREVIADIKKGEVWESEEKIISLMNTNDVVITLKDRDRRINSMGFVSSTLYHLQRKEYTFEEAFKAYEEGKEIESCYSGVKYLIQHGGSDCYSDGRKTNLIEFNEIRGKWYINN